jgi:cell division protein FtsA
MPSNYICALDIGSSKIAAVVAEIKRRRIVNIFFETVPSKGIKKGTIIDPVDLVNSISRALKNLRIKSGINIKFIYTNISGLHIVTKRSRAIIPLAERGNKVIATSDIEKVNEQARILGSSLDEEIMHQIPLSYAIDSNNNILNPIGLYSHRLEVDLYLICGNLSYIQSLIHVINQAGYEVKDLFFSGIATSRAAFHKELKEGISILCDIGSDITELLIFEDGILKNMETLQIGGDDLTNKLAEALKIPFDLAENVKRSYAGIAEHNQIKEDREILLKKDNVYTPIKQRLVSEILGSETRLISQSIKDTVEKSVACNKINNFVTTGRTILLEGFLETLESNLGISVKLGHMANPDTEVSTSRRDVSKSHYIRDMISLVNKYPALSGQKYLTYLTSLGIIRQALHNQQPSGVVSTYPLAPTCNPILKVINKAREVYKEYF